MAKLRFIFALSIQTYRAWGIFQGNWKTHSSQRLPVVIKGWNQCKGINRIHTFSFNLWKKYESFVSFLPKFSIICYFVSHKAPPKVSQMEQSKKFQFCYYSCGVLCDQTILYFFLLRLSFLCNFTEKELTKLWACNCSLVTLLSAATVFKSKADQKGKKMLLFFFFF